MKNAVVSGILSALSRESSSPVITQQDLILGCRLQMRSSLTSKSNETRGTSARYSLGSLEFSPVIRKALENIIRFEATRSMVYGSWNIGSGSDSGSGGAMSIQQKACLCMFAGPKGSGKHTAVNCLAYECGKVIKHIHILDILSSSTSESIAHLENLLNDARYRILTVLYRIL